MMKLNLPTTPIATAFGMPLDDAIEQLATTARDLTAAAEKTSRSQGFGSRLAEAVKRRSPRYANAAANVFTATTRKDNDDDDDDDDEDEKEDPENESFGKKVKRAIERKSRGTKTQKQHQKIAERERRRYQQQRPAPKSV